MDINSDNHASLNRWSVVAIGIFAVLLSACDSGAISSLSTGGGEVSLKWTAPSARADGSQLLLSDIAGYRVYYSKTKGQYTRSESFYIAGGDTVQATLPSSASLSGRYYIVMTAIDVDARESAYSTPPLEIGAGR